MKKSHCLKHTNDAEVTLYQKQKMKGFETAELFPCFSDLFDFHVRYRELIHIYRHSFLANSIIDNGINKILEF